MQYKVQLRPRAAKFLKTIPSIDRDRIQSKIHEISSNPRDHGVIKMAGKDPEQYRARQGNYRIVFTIQDDLLLIEVIEIDHRKDVYRR